MLSNIQSPQASLRSPGTSIQLTDLLLNIEPSQMSHNTDNTPINSTQRQHPSNLINATVPPRRLLTRPSAIRTHTLPSESTHLCRLPYSYPQIGVSPTVQTLDDLAAQKHKNYDALTETQVDGMSVEDLVLFMQERDERCRKSIEEVQEEWMRVWRGAYGGVHMERKLKVGEGVACDVGVNTMTNRVFPEICNEPFGHQDAGFIG
ncbi:hypothetical protein BCR33DRAFT_717088 [Rhizoclosmatium globosum]|uniref:Uncharacterized protein n=1 Tax=Rhizoclosmatium globosum TaxID=329046 RepID=A0A1Y2CAA7_9FUNG|nr:hypothetical protein BCR33DRAFT_717088 [Rhizoclosmatium globosum]|eukprot:ORY43962.1 hypothetical protein BCR33DRAFT_717088 [Rhizoclosmatium globosum]